MKVEMRTRLADFDLPREIMEEIVRVLRYAAAAEAVPAVFCVTVGFTDDGRIRKFNRTFRGIDQATDVLSFPMTAGKKEWATAKGHLLPGIEAPSLGDILISLEHCEKQALCYGHSLRREICFLALHGFLHLLGYDHEEAAARLVMEEKTEAYLNALGVIR